jgi:hypothetical protein
MNLRRSLLALALLAAPAAAEDSARDLLQKVIDSTPSALAAKSTLTTGSHLKRDMTVNHKRIGGEGSTYIEVTAPGDVAGTRFLLKEKTESPDEQFIYIPAVKRAIKVSEETRKQPFLGSDFYVADLVAPDLDAYDFSFGGEEVIEGRKTRLVEAKAKNPEKELYGKVVFAVDPADLLIVRSRFFDKNGEALKVLTIKKLEKIDGVWTPMLQEMTTVEGSSTSTIVVNEVNYKAELPDGMFDRSYLLQERS